jgi:hypothetical protein
MNLPKQQHWVPRFYLRFFATLETVDRDEGPPRHRNRSRRTCRRVADSDGNRRKRSQHSSHTATWRRRQTPWVSASGACCGG